MGSSLATLASRPGRRAAATLAVLLLLSACQADAGAPEEPVEGLLVLTTGDAAGLEVLATAPDGAVAIGLPLPADGASWVSAGRGGILVASTTDGQLATSDPVDPRGSAVDVASLEWRPVETKDASGGAVQQSAWFPTWDPGGRRFAALGGDLLGGGEMTLLVIDPTEGALAMLPLRQPLPAAAPIWLDASRVALVSRASEEPGALVIDTGNGKIAKGPSGARRLAASADGSVVATSEGSGDPIVLRSAKGWLADDGTTIGSVEMPEGFSEAAALALDATGRRLAIVWQRDDGTTECHVHDGNDGWRRVLKHSGNVIAWLR
jgi:hypothetical protein